MADDILGLDLKGGTLQNIPSSASLDVQAAALNDVINRLNNLLKFQNFSDGANNIVQLGILPDGSVGFKINDANGVGLALFGQFPDGTTALKVAKANHEVSTAPNDQLIFNSAQNVFKIVASGIATIPACAAPGTGVVTVNHGLGYQPVVIAYLATSGGVSVQLPYFSHNVGGAQDGLLGTSYNVGFITTSTVQFRQTASSFEAAQPAHDVKYYLLQETAT